jgi:hypothetical protein
LLLEVAGDFKQFRRFFVITGSLGVWVGYALSAETDCRYCAS